MGEGGEEEHLHVLVFWRMFVQLEPANFPAGDRGQEKKRKELMSRRLLEESVRVLLSPSGDMVSSFCQSILWMNKIT